MDDPGSESNAPGHWVQFDCPMRLNSLSLHMPETAESEVVLQKKPDSHGLGTDRPAALQYDPMSQTSGLNMPPTGQ